MTEPGTSWAAYLQERFPGYLLPDSAAAELSVEAATNFLAGISGRADQLLVLRAASLIAPQAARLQRFVNGSLPAFVQNLPSCTRSERRRWDGGFHGRLAIAPTLTHWIAGQRTTFVTESRRRAFDLPENIVVRHVCAALLHALVVLRRAGALPGTGWGHGLVDCEGTLRSLLSATALRHVPDTRPDQYDENAARSARHPACREAADWLAPIRDALETNDPHRIARLVAEGALHPLSEPTRFELATVIRLIEALESRFSPPSGWTVERCLVIGGARRELVSFARADGVRVNVHYNQATLPSGISDRSVRHYLNGGVLRPDVTVIVENGSRAVGAIVFECKHSPNFSYMAQGFREATLYRWEYAESLPFPVKAVLITSHDIPGAVRESDDVIAVDWRRWVPDQVLDAVTRGVSSIER